MISTVWSGGALCLAVVSCWLLLSSSVASRHVQDDETARRYDRYQLLELHPQTQADIEYLNHLKRNYDQHIEFWSEPLSLDRHTELLLHPDVAQGVKQQLTKRRLHYRLATDDLQRWIDESSERLSRRGLEFSLDDFNTLDQIHQWLDEIATSCPEEFTCTVYSIGDSFEGRPIKFLKISKDTADGSNRWGFWLDATIHAREWLAGATALKIINHLVTSDDSDVRELRESYDWYIGPILNPDGYVYTHTKDRLWRKNRSTVNGSRCIGTDLNRNYNFHWGTDGVSHRPCDYSYCGPKAESEVETVSIAREMDKLGGSLVAMVTLHAYGNMWMIPFGYTNNSTDDCVRPGDYEEQMVVANAAADAVQATYNTSWDRGTTCEVVYENSGSTVDYAHAVAGVPYTVAVEVRGGRRGFIIEPTEIDPSFQEIWNGIRAMAITIQSGERYRQTS